MISTYILQSLITNLLWQSLLIACVVAAVLYALPAHYVKTRYRIALGGLLSVLCLLSLPFLPDLAPEISLGVTPQPSPVFTQTTFPVNEDASTILNQQIMESEKLKLSLGYILLSVWGLGTVFMYIRLGFAARHGRNWCKSAQPVQSNHWDLSRNVHIARSAQISSPLVLGLMRPVILVPLDFDLNVSNVQTRAVLEHEIAHITRRDLWVNFAQLIILALLWWCLPLYWMNAQIDSEREKLCDDIAARNCGNNIGANPREQGRALARALVDIAERSRMSTPQTAIGIHPSARQLSERVQRLYKGSPMTKISKKLLITTSLAIPLTLSSLALITPRAFAHNPFAEHINMRSQMQNISSEQLVLYSSAEHGDLETVKNLLGRGVDPDFILHGDGTPLLVAVRRNDKAMVDMFLAAGADANITALGDGTPLIAAAIQGNIAMINLLEKHGARVDHSSSGDGNPLIAAAATNHIEAAKTLLGLGANINVFVLGDETPLINASQRGHLDMVKFLLSNGADINLGAWHDTNKSGKIWRTPLGEAKLHRHHKLAAYLKAQGAQIQTRIYDPKSNNTHTEVTTYNRSAHVLSNVKMVKGKLTSPFGQVRKGKMFAGKKHKGIDIANKAGTPIYAPADGMVQVFNEFSFRENYGSIEKYGKTLELKTAGGVKTLFAHLQSFAVRQGDVVKAGDIIAYMGNTGVSTGPHVHIETHVNGTLTDPKKVWPNLN